MTDRVLPGLGMEVIAASNAVNRLALMDQGFRRWVSGALYQHLRCNWGHVTPMQSEQNFASVVIGGPLLSRWPFGDDALLIVQDSTHETATVMLESEQVPNFSGPQHQEV